MVVAVAKQPHTLKFCPVRQYLMTSTDSLGIMVHIVRFCETSKDKDRIKNRLGLNDVQAESYLAILTRQRMIMQNNGQYVITVTGQSSLNSYDRLGKIGSIQRERNPTRTPATMKIGKRRISFRSLVLGFTPENSEMQT